jgi:hypothetical protein
MYASIPHGAGTAAWQSRQLNPLILLVSEPALSTIRGEGLSRNALDKIGDHVPIVSFDLKRLRLGHGRIRQVLHSRVHMGDGIQTCPAPLPLWRPGRGFEGFQDSIRKTTTAITIWFLVKRSDFRVKSDLGLRTPGLQ